MEELDLLRAEVAILRGIVNWLVSKQPDVDSLLDLLANHTKVAQEELGATTTPDATIEALGTIATWWAQRILQDRPRG